MATEACIEPAAAKMKFKKKRGRIAFKLICGCRNKKNGVGLKDSKQLRVQVSGGTHQLSCEVVCVCYDLCGLLKTCISSDFGTTECGNALDNSLLC